TSSCLHPFLCSQRFYFPSISKFYFSHFTEIKTVLLCRLVEIYRRNFNQRQYRSNKLKNFSILPSCVPREHKRKIFAYLPQFFFCVFNIIIHLYIRKKLARLSLLNKSLSYTFFKLVCCLIAYSLYFYKRSINRSVLN